MGSPDGDDTCPVTGATVAAVWPCVQFLEMVFEESPLSAVNPPLVTVITPTFNRAAFLRETITSVLTQDYPNIEYIVLDDGSTDDTLAVVEEYRGRVTYISHANMGHARTVNIGLQMARGEYVGVVNSDDPILPGLVRRAVEAFQEAPHLLVVYPDWRMIDQASNTVKRVRTPDYDYPNMVRWQKCLIGPGAFMRKAALSLEPGWDPTYRFVGDFGYWLRLGLHGPFARIPAVLATHRVHPGAASGQEDQAWAAETMRLVDAYFARAHLPPEVRKLEREARCNATYNAGRICMASAPQQARAYFRESLRYSLSSYLRWRPQRLVMLAVAYLPGTLSPVARKWLEKLAKSPLRYYRKS